MTAHAKAFAAGDRVRLNGSDQIGRVARVTAERVVVDIGGAELTLAASLISAEPDPETIEAETARIRAGWTPAEAERRRVGAGRVAWTVPETGPPNQNQHRKRNAE